jgi:hypothetical protein
MSSNDASAAEARPIPIARSVVCKACSAEKTSDLYSNSQLKKPTPTCKDCIEKTSSSASNTQHELSSATAKLNIGTTATGEKPHQPVTSTSHDQRKAANNTRKITNARPKNFFVTCPNCDLMIEVSHFNCGVFRHGI